MKKPLERWFSREAFLNFLVFSRLWRSIVSLTVSVSFSSSQPFSLLA